MNLSSDSLINHVPSWAGAAPARAPGLFSAEPRRNPADCIDLTGYGVGNQSDPLAGLPPKPPSPYASPSPQPTQVKKRLLAAKIRRRYTALIRQRFDLKAFGWNDPVLGKPQTSRAALQAHHNALFAKFQRDMGNRAVAFDPADLLEDVPAARIRNAGAGNEVIRLRSKWKTSGVNRTAVRADLDAHRGQTDMDAAQDFVNAQFPQTTLYWCNAPLGRGGRSGYFWLVVPTFVDPRTGNVRPLMKRRQVNRLILDINDALRALARKMGIQSGVEAKGGYLLTKQDRDPKTNEPVAPKRVCDKALDGQFLANIPEVESLEDMVTWEAAEIPADDPGLLDLIRRGKEAQAWLDAEAKAKREELEALLADDGEDDEEDTTPPAPQKTRLRRKSVEAKETKHGNRATAICVALHQLDIRSREELRHRRAEVIALAMSIYIEKGWGNGVNDLKRLADFNSSYNKVYGTFDPTKIGKQAKTPVAPAGKKPTVYFDSKDNRRLARTYRSPHRKLIHKANIRLANLGQGHALLNEEKLAWIENTFAKNSVVDKNGNLRPSGPAPISRKSVRRMLAHWHISADGSTIAEAIAILVATGRIKSVDYARHNERKCGTWVISQPHLYRFLPGHAEAAHTKRMERLNRLRQKQLQERREKTGWRDPNAAKAPTGAAGATAQFLPLMTGYKESFPTVIVPVIEGNEYEEVDIEDWSPEIEENEPELAF